MKTNPATPQITALLSAIVLVGTVSFSQPAYGQSARPPRIDPVNGMQIPDNQTNQDVILGEHSMSSDPNLAPMELHELIHHGRYAEALQLCHSFHNSMKNSSVTAIIPDWIELGRRFPQAREDLIEIRDHDLREFSQGRGYSDLFGEVDFINSGLHQDDSTYALFKTIREKDPELAQQCFSFVEGLLVAKGEYQWCYDHMGDPQGVFDGIYQNLDQHLAEQRRMAELHQETAQRMETFNRQQGRTNLWSQPDYASSALKRFAHDNFVGGTRQLIEILVATNHKADAEKIRDEAVAILDDPRLQSAVSDAETKIKK
jgi:hypothetical protein